MKHKPLPVIVFLTLMLSSLLAGRHSYCTAKEELTADLNQALALIVKEKTRPIVTQDTIKVYKQLRKTSGGKVLIAVSDERFCRYLKNKRLKESAPLVCCCHIRPFRPAPVSRTDGSCLPLGDIRLVIHKKKKGRSKNAGRKHRVRRTGLLGNRQPFLQCQPRPHPFHSHAGTAHPDVLERSFPCADKRRNLYSPLAQERRRQRHTLYPYPTGKAHHREPYESQNRSRQREELFPGNQRTGKLTRDCQTNVSSRFCRLYRRSLLLFLNNKTGTHESTHQSDSKRCLP